MNIHDRALAAAKKFKQSEIELIEALQAVYEKHAYYQKKRKSIHDYAVTFLGLSDSVAYVYTNVARKAHEIPALHEGIRSGDISVYKAKAICSVITEDNKAQWLELAKSEPKHRLERAVAIASPRAVVKESARFVAPTPDKVFVEIKVGVEEEVMKLLRQAQDIVSQSKQAPASLADTIEAMARLFVKKKDPLEKAKRSKLVLGLKNAYGASVKHQVYVKCNGQCSHPGCGQKRWLEIHHIVPRSQGGSNELDNLTLLCRGHHQSHHRIAAKSF